MIIIKEPNNVRAPFFQKFSFGMGAFGEVLMSNILFFLANPIYNLNLGVEAWLIGLAVSIPRLWDAVTDPIMGNITDNTKSRWGRRKPYVLSGAILTGVLCFFLWTPPTGASHKVLFGYLLVISLLYFTTYTVFNIPFAALGFELSTDYDERTRVMGYKVFFGNCAAFILPWAYKLCFVFGKDRNPLDGIKWVGLIFGIMIIIFGVFPALFCKENRTAQHQKSINIFAALKYTLKNKAYIILCCAISIMLIGFYLAFPLLLYMNLAIVCPGNDELAAQYAAYSQTTYSVMGIVTVPLIAWLGTRIGKRNTLMAACVIVSIACLLSWFCFTPKYPLLQILFSALASPGMTCVWMMGFASIADVCDLDELETGLRREGVYIAIFGWLIKCAFAGTMAISGLMLSWSGFMPKAASQTPQTIIALRVLFCVMPVLFLAVAFILFLKFPLTKSKVIEVQNLLRKNSSQDDNEERI